MKDLLTIKSFNNVFTDGNMHQVKYGHVKDRSTLEKEIYEKFGSKVMFPIAATTEGPETVMLRSKGIFIETPNTASVGTGEVETWVRWEKGEKIREKYTPIARSYTIRNVYADATTKEPRRLMSPEEYDIVVKGEEVVQTNTVAMPEWKVSRKIYFKYFWLFYIVAKDYWDKYPDDIHIQTKAPEKPLTEEEKEEILKKEKPIFEEALREAKKNYPEYELAEKMVEAKKKEGTYWEELKEVYKESIRLKEEIKKQAEEEKALKPN